MQLFSQVRKSFCGEGRSELSPRGTLDTRDRLKLDLNLFGETLRLQGGVQGFTDLSVLSPPALLSPIHRSSTTIGPSPFLHLSLLLSLHVLQKHVTFLSSILLTFGDGV